MKRDPELIREIILMIQDHQPTDEAPVIWQFKDDRIYHAHLALLIDAEYVRGTAKKMGDGSKRVTSVYDLTWAGHDLADTLRDDGVWNKVKQRIGGKVSSASIDVIKTVATDTVTKLILGG